MTTFQRSAIPLFVSAALSSAAFGVDPTPQAPASHEAPALPQPLAPIAAPHSDQVEADIEQIDFAQPPPAPVSPIRAMTSAAAAGTTLSPPVTITYSGSSNAVTITDSGTNRGLSSSLTNTGNSNSAVYGETKGSGAGVKGINSGSTGSAGVFSINNSASSKTALTGSTNGPGSAISGTVTTASSNQPAVLGTSTKSANYGIGIEGVANNIGAYGISNGTSGVGYGLYGYSLNGAAGTAGLSSAGIGVFGESSSSYGLFGESTSSIGVYGYSVHSNGVYALSYSGDALYASSTSGRGMTVHSVSGIGIYSNSESSYGVWGQSKNQFGVIGEDSGSGVGVYGSSATGYAGYFAGKVAATSYLTVSDRNAKTDFAPVDPAQVLERVSQLPVTSWAFKGDRALRHIGPMAQDFHAAFGLDGDDDRHISLSDATGVSLVAIQELARRVKERDAKIAMLEAQIKSMNDQFAARLAKIEQQVAGSPRVMTAYVTPARP